MNNQQETLNHILLQLNNNVAIFNLNLNDNTTDEELDFFAKILEKNITIQEISIPLSNSNQLSQWSIEKIKKIVQILQHHQSLTTVTIDFYKYQGYDGTSSIFNYINFLEIFKGSTSIKQLALKNLQMMYNNRDIVLENFFFELGLALQENKTLETFSLIAMSFPYKELKSVFFKNLAIGLQNKLLQKITVDDVSLTNTPLDEITNVLCSINTLNHLEFNSCNLTEIELNSIFSIMNKNVNLQKFYLDLNNLDEYVGLFIKLANEVAKQKNLDILSLRSTKLDSENLMKMLKIWQEKNWSAHTLCLDENYFDDSGYQALANWLTTGIRLKNLSLSNCDPCPTNSQLKILAEALSNPQCKVSILKCEGSSNFLTDETVESFKTASQNNPCLHKLFLTIPSTQEAELNLILQKNYFNKKIKQQQFVNTAIVIANAHYNPISTPQNHNKFSLMPLDILLILMSHLGQDLIDKEQEEIILCSTLIFNNFYERHQLLAAKKKEIVSPKNLNEEKIEINFSWWSQTIKSPQGIMWKIFQSAHDSLYIKPLTPLFDNFSSTQEKDNETESNSSDTIRNDEMACLIQ